MLHDGHAARCALGRPTTARGSDPPGSLSAISHHSRRRAIATYGDQNETFPRLHSKKDTSNKLFTIEQLMEWYEKNGF